MDQKSLASHLDRAAARADLIDREPATRKQCWFLAGLITNARDEKQIDEIILNTSFVLTKRGASALIDGYLKH